MDQILSPQLSEVELDADRGASCHEPYSVSRPIRLKDIGYAKEVLGDLVLTDNGLQRIAEAK
jgi:hypothetical protein